MVGRQERSVRKLISDAAFCDNAIERGKGNAEHTLAATLCEVNDTGFVGKTAEHSIAGTSETFCDFIYREILLRRAAGIFRPFFQRMAEDEHIMFDYCVPKTVIDMVWFDEEKEFEELEACVESANALYPDTEAQPA
jgi:hypothetical protein